MPLALVILGLAYAAVAIDAEDATAYLVITLAVGAAAGADVLGHIPQIGVPLDAIVDQVSVALYAGVITVLVIRTFIASRNDDDGSPSLKHLGIVRLTVLDM